MVREFWELANRPEIKYFWANQWNPNDVRDIRIRYSGDRLELSGTKRYEKSQNPHRCLRQGPSNHYLLTAERSDKYLVLLYTCRNWRAGAVQLVGQFWFPANKLDT